jgi:hypothetical protein
MTFEEMIGGKDTQYIKCKEVEQSPDGKTYAVVYNDDGMFYLRHFGKETRSKEDIEKTEVDINRMLQINNFTMCNQSFPDPFITCTFLDSTKIFVNLYHNFDRKHFHFVFDTNVRKPAGLASFVMDSNLKNFPYKCFHNPDLNEIYSFYRQGQAIIVNGGNTEQYTVQRMTEFDLG